MANFGPLFFLEGRFLAFQPSIEPDHDVIEPQVVELVAVAFVTRQTQIAGLVCAPVFDRNNMIDMKTR